MTEDKPDTRPLILQQLDGHWQKIVTLLLMRFSRDAPVTLTLEDFQRLGAYMENHKLLTWGHHDSIELRLVTPEQAERITQHVESMGGRVENPS